MTVKQYVESVRALELPLLFVGFGVSSVCMTLLNKQLSQILPEPFTLLVLQNACACVFGWFFSQIGLIPILAVNQLQLMLAFANSILFSAMICTSMFALSTSSTALVIVFRNSSPLLTSLLEYFFLNGHTSFREAVFLMCTLGGAIVYSLGDLSADGRSFAWCTINLILSCTLTIFEKWITNKLKEQQTSSGLLLLRNLFSTAAIVPLALWMSTNQTTTTAAQPTATDSLSSMSISLSSFNLVLIFLSCIFGYLIGFIYFLLQRRTAAVSINVANCTYKLLTVAISFFLFASSYKFYIWIGLGMSFLGSFGYIYERTLGGGNKSNDSKDENQTLQSLSMLHIMILIGLVTVTGSTIIHNYCA